MHLLLATLKVVYVLTTPKPTQPGNSEEESLQAARTRLKWENDDLMCRGHILNSMSDDLFDTYQHMATAKEIWDALEQKYITEDAASKKFLVSKFNCYKMVDSRSIVEQFYEIQRILQHLKQNNMNMDEAISVTSIIDKLPPSWKNVKHGLKHKKEDISLKELLNYLQIEEEYKKQEDVSEPKDEKSKVLNVEGAGPSKNSKGNNKRFNHPTKGQSQNKKKKGACFHCGKPRHFKRDCRLRKKEKESNNAPRENFAAMIFEANVLEDTSSWWIDSGATRHVCNNKTLFKKMESMDDGTVLYMGNSASIKVQEK
jgi:hypothetical protein